MFVDQLDPKKTLMSVGVFIAYHNRLRFLANQIHGTKGGEGLKRLPERLQPRLEIVREVRNRLCKETWEIIDSTIFALNDGVPNWHYKKRDLQRHIIEVRDDLADEVIKLSKESSQRTRHIKPESKI